MTCTYIRSILSLAHVLTHQRRGEGMQAPYSLYKLRNTNLDTRFEWLEWSETVQAAHLLIRLPIQHSTYGLVFFYKWKRPRLAMETGFYWDPASESIIGVNTVCVYVCAWGIELSANSIIYYSSKH